MADSIDLVNCLFNNLNKFTFISETMSYHSLSESQLYGFMMIYCRKSKQPVDWLAQLAAITNVDIVENYKMSIKEFKQHYKMAIFFYQLGAQHAKLNHAGLAALKEREINDLDQLTKLEESIGATKNQ